MFLPLWMASPPEVHSALLSSGPGPGPLLAAAGTWSSLSTEYTEAAAELTAVLDAVQAGAWEGPSATQYAAAHGPYLSWLLDSAAKSTTAAALHQTAAGAYTGALAAMPTLAELAANHTIHGALLATNFFGINTIPIALNEADYVRMWIQAAETMTLYHAVSDSALAAVPPTTPAPAIVAPGAPATAAAQQAGTGTSWQDQLAQWITEYNMGFADPLAKLLFYPDGYPISPMPLVNALQPLFAQIPGIAPGLASALAWTVFHNLMLIYPLLQASPLLFAFAVPAALAATGATGLAGLAALAGVPDGTPTLPEPAPNLPATATTPAPPGGVTAASTSPGGIETTLSNASSGTTAPGTAVADGGLAGGGPGAGFGPTATDGFYAASVAGLSASNAASARRPRRTELPDSDDAGAPAGTASAGEQARARRRRAARLRGHGNEFMDMTIEVEPDWAAASDRGAGPLGFAGAAAKPEVARAAGLTTLADTELSGGPTLPMLPRSWSA